MSLSTNQRQEYRARRLRLHRFVPRTEVEGPGIRACVWVQGCHLACPGCFNPETHDYAGGTPTTIGELFDTVAAQSGLNGITLCGGEPFSQAHALAALGTLCQERGLSVVTYTGYEYAMLVQANHAPWNALLAVTDLLLAGPYLSAQEDYSRPWVGSRNQQFIFLTGRYRFLEEKLHQIPNALEVSIDGAGRLHLNGQASRRIRNQVVAAISCQGIRLHG